MEVEIWDVVDVKNLFQRVNIKYAMGWSYAVIVIWDATGAKNLFQMVKKENSPVKSYVPIVIGISMHHSGNVILGSQFVKSFLGAITLRFIDFESKGASKKGLSEGVLCGLASDGYKGIQSHNPIRQLTVSPARLLTMRTRVWSRKRRSKSKITRQPA